MISLQVGQVWTDRYKTPSFCEILEVPQNGNKPVVCRCGKKDGKLKVVKITRSNFSETGPYFLVEAP